MAKIFRINGYMIDANGEFDREYMTDLLNGDLTNCIDTFGQHIHVDEAEFEWNDELPINFENCDLAYCEEYFKDIPIHYECDEEREIPKVGETWMHFKEGKTVVIHSISKNSENPSQVLVTYMCPNGLYTRPMDMFMSKVDKVKYPNATQEWRFERVNLK